MTNPVQKTCWETCPVCFKCANRNRQSGTSCNKCPGRNDPMHRLSYDDRVFCDCRNGVLRHMTKEGRLIVRNFPNNPYETKVVQEKVTQEERDWEYYLQGMREALDDPYWDPLRFNDDTSVSEWNRQHRG